MLQLKDVHAYYGQAAALRGVSLEAPRGQIVTVLGANGSGKTATIKTIAGLLPASGGSSEFAGPRQISGSGSGLPIDGRRVPIYRPRPTGERNSREFRVVWESVGP